jgi:hypothetical protein
VEAGVVAGRAINAEPGAFVLTGVDAGLVAARVIAANPGVYVLTGADAGLLAQRVLDAQPGSFVLTGFTADLVPPSFAAYEINAEPGVFTITGYAAWANLNLENFPSAGGQRIRIDLATGQLVLIVNEKTVMTL